MAVIIWLSAGIASSILLFRIVCRTGKVTDFFWCPIDKWYEQICNRYSNRSVGDGDLFEIDTHETRSNQLWNIVLKESRNEAPKHL